MKLHKIALGAAVLVAPLAVSGSPASADSHERIEIRIDFTQAFSDFTNCPVPGSLAVEVSCIGSSVVAQTIDKHVGETESNTSIVYVDMSTVHVHPNGTFDIDPTPFASGSGPAKIDSGGLRRSSVSASVAMNDGTTAMVRAAFTGSGVLNPYSGTATNPEPGCPSGSADLAYRGTFRDAIATGTLKVNGVVQTPTTALFPASMDVERDKGNCTVPV